MCAVTFILLIVGIISRFLQYLGQAVAGELSSDVLLLLMFYRLPDFLLVILPLAFFLGILLAYGRMYAENEMLILLGAGTSQLRLLYLTLGTSLIVLVITAFISLSLAPWGVRNTEQLKQNQEQLTEIDLIVAGQFQAFSGGERVTYTERIDNSPILGRQLQNVFVALSNQEQEVEQAPPRIVLAETAQPEVNRKPVHASCALKMYYSMTEHRELGISMWPNSMCILYCFQNLPNSRKYLKKKQWRLRSYLPLILRSIRRSYSGVCQ